MNTLPFILPRFHKSLSRSNEATVELPDCIERFLVLFGTSCKWFNCRKATDSFTHYVVHGPEQISVPSGCAKLGNVFHVHICPVHHSSHDRPLNSTAFMRLSPILIILFPKNNIFVFFNEFQIVFKLKPSKMTVLIECN